MAVHVAPAVFSLVFYRSDEIAALGQEMMDHLGMAGDLTIEVDETTPLTRSSATRLDDGGVRVKAESGAFEDNRKPRSFSPLACSTSLARALLRLRDREDQAFGTPPADADLTLAQVATWDLYSVARLRRLGYTVNRQRWLYNFRNRHGFTDAIDEVFDRIFTAEQLTWGQLDELSHSALALAR